MNNMNNMDNMNNMNSMNNMNNMLNMNNMNNMNNMLNMNNVNNLNNMNIINMNNMNQNQMINNNIDINPHKEDIINHLINQNQILYNQIEMNNKLIQKLNQNSQNLNINNSLENNNPYFHVLPKKENNIYDIFPLYNGKKIHLSFSTQTGGKTLLIAPENIKIFDLFSEFMKIMKLDNNLIGDRIFFLYNGYKINQKDYEKTLLEFGLRNLSTIIVLDINNIIGG